MDYVVFETLVFAMAQLCTVPIHAVNEASLSEVFLSAKMGEEVTLKTSTGQDNFAPEARGLITHAVGADQF